MAFAYLGALTTLVNTEEETNLDVEENDLELIDIVSGKTRKK